VIEPDLSSLSADATLLARLHSQILPPAFYDQPTLDIARQLLGKVLVAVPEADSLDEPTAGIIVETEGYIALTDPACHAYTGRTRRNDVMWGAPGHAYIYFTYGNHWMINVVTGPEGEAAAALIRAIEPIMGLAQMRARRGLHLLKGRAEDRQLANGPGKLCQALGVTGQLNGTSLQGPTLFIASPPPELTLPPFETVETTRIGITRGVELPWRYYVKGNRYVSKL
jgi:DNA-3-methyladenine glycosylase